jgi:hypothetical protein
LKKIEIPFFYFFQNRIDELLRQNAMLLDVIEGLLAPDDSPITTSKANIKDSLTLLRSELNTRQAQEHSRKLNSQKSAHLDGSTSTSSTDGQVGLSSSPDSGIKTSFSYHLNDDETY